MFNDIIMKKEERGNISAYSSNSTSATFFFRGAATDLPKFPSSQEQNRPPKQLFPVLDISLLLSDREPPQSVLSGKTCGRESGGNALQARMHPAYLQEWGESLNYPAKSQETSEFKDWLNKHHSNTTRSPRCLSSFKIGS
jgi:hypothetical protein